MKIILTGFMHNRILKIFILALICIWGESALAQRSTIVGTVTDSDIKEPMPFASVTVKGTTIGSVTDINGKYTLTGVPSGQQQIEFRYLGYQSQLLDVTVVPGKTVELNASLTSEAIQSLEVVIVGQAKGQTQAINQQLNSQGIVNVVSLEKMKELPDPNAAEAVGQVTRDNGSTQWRGR